MPVGRIACLLLLWSCYNYSYCCWATFSMCPYYSYCYNYCSRTSSPEQTLSLLHLYLATCCFFTSLPMNVISTSFFTCFYCPLYLSLHLLFTSWKMTKTLSFFISHFFIHLSLYYCCFDLLLLVQIIISCQLLASIQIQRIVHTFTLDSY